MAQVRRDDHGAWAWTLGLGVISVVVGLILIFFPGLTLLAIAVLFGIQLVVVGVFRFIDALLTHDQSGWMRASAAVLSVLALVVGIYLLRHPFLSVLILAMLLGIFWMVHGIVDLVIGIGHRELPARGWAIFAGAASLVAGGVVFFLPAISLLYLTLVLGVWLVVYGALAGITAFRLRSAAHGAAGYTGGRVSPT